jgi:hypothetical protein
MEEFNNINPNKTIFEESKNVDTIQPISKNQMKKLKRREYWEQNKQEIRKAKKVFFVNSS